MDSMEQSTATWVNLFSSALTISVVVDECEEGARSGAEDIGGDDVGG